MMLEHTSDGDAAESDAEDGREVEGNARITAMLGLSLLIAFAIESVTVIDVRQMFTWHVFVGLFIVPVVCFKLAITGYRSCTTTEVRPPTATRVRRTRSFVSVPRS